MRMIIVVFFCFALFAIGGLLFAFLFQHKMTFFPTPLAQKYKWQLGPKDEEGFLSLPTGEKINYLLYAGDSQSKGRRTGQIIYFHGNAGNLSDWGPVGENLRQKTGYTVWIMDYPGYGKSSGETRDEKILIAMGKHFITTVQAQNPGGRLVLFGRSIGTGIAAALATAPDVKGLILETPYVSLLRLAKEHYPFLPTALMRIHLTTENLAKLDPLPRTLILHGTQDEVIPYQHAKDLATQLPSAKLVTIENGTHSNLSAFPVFWTELENFLQTLP